MSDKKLSETKKITIVCTQEEAEAIQKQANGLEISVNQFIKRLIFPDAYSDSVDSAVYKAMRECKQITESVAVRMSLQKHLDYRHGDYAYCWFERYNYIFLKAKKSNNYLPLCHVVLGRTPLQSIALAIINRQSLGSCFTVNDFEFFSQVLKVFNHPEKEETYIIENNTILQRYKAGYKIVSE